MNLNLLKNKFLFFGHRGAPEFAPENTYISFKKAIEMGVDGIELDVILTMDDRIVVHHDIDILKLTGNPDKIYKMNHDDLKKIDASGKWNSKFGFQKIPLLNEIIELLNSNQIILNIEIKSTGFFPKKIVDNVIKFITEHNLDKRCIVSSFNPLIIRKIKKLSPQIFTSLIWSHKGVSFLLKWYQPLYFICKPDGFHPDKLYTNEKLVKWAKAKKLLIYVFTVNTKDELDKVRTLGINGVFTDNPKIID